MGKIRCKFLCTQKTLNQYAGAPNNNYSLEFTAVYNNSPENKLFFAATPSGKITLSVVSETIFNNFELGKEYYLDFTIAAM